MDWYYADSDIPNGPHADEEIRRLLQAEQINADTLLWREGMIDWTPLRGLPEFAESLRRNIKPPPIPTASLEVSEGARDWERAKEWEPVQETADTIAAPTNTKLEGAIATLRAPVSKSEVLKNSPWSRYFARALDLTVMGAIAGLIVGYASAFWAPTFYYQLLNLHPQAQAILLLPIALVINGLVAAIFGTTMGKKVMGLRFIYLNGRLGLAGHVLRELKVWVQGLALGIPIAWIFTGLAQYRRITAGEPASYDVGVALVKQRDMPVWRRAVGMSFCALIFFMGIVWSAWPDNAARSLSPHLAASVAIEWTNPLTGVSARLPAGWIASSQDNGQGAIVHVFISADGTKHAVFGAEPAIPGVNDLAAYGRALKIGLAGAMTFGEFKTTSIPGVMRADGSFNGEGWPASVLITRAGERFWRIVSIDTTAHGGDVTVPALARALWSTTN